MSARRKTSNLERELHARELLDWAKTHYKFGHYAHVIRLYRLAVGNGAVLTAEHLRRLANCHLRTGSPATALMHLRRCHDIIEKSRDKEAIAAIRTTLALLYAVVGMPKRAARFASLALGL